MKALDVYTATLCALWFSYNVAGHVERFSDYMVKDLKNGECFRADHLKVYGVLNDRYM